MTIIDQSILIPAAPGAVWAIISDINSNARWQADYESVSFLTSSRSGSGVRWRYASSGGSDFVVETTAWYDGIGYEYTFIDGTPFRESKGRLRLQEIAEGTIVQWSLEYEMGGMLAGMRNSLSVRRHYEKTMVSSLRGLWTFVKESGGTRQSHEAKSLMRDAPDYEERSQYVPRHPSRASDRQDAPLLDEEPPVADEDTRPNPTVAAPEPEQSASDQGWIEMEPVKIAASTDTDEREAVDAGDHSRFQPPPANDDDDLEILVQPDPDPGMAAAPETDDLDRTTVLPELAEEMENPLEPAQDDVFGPKVDTSKIDTREISIWEVFGVPSPSETQRMRAIKVDEHGEPLENQEDSQALEAVNEAEPMAPMPDTAKTVEEAEPDFQIAPTPEPVEVAGTAEPAVEVAPQPEIEPVIETPAPSNMVAAGAVTRPSLVPVAEPLIVGYRVSARRRFVKIRSHR